MDPCCTISQNTNISSIVAGHRKSNFELLRIISMFMVLGLHVNFKHIGIPELSATDHNYLQILFQTIVEAICLPAVNIFILISGWFSIKASLKGLISFIFQYIFVVSVSYGCYLLSSGSEITVNAILSCLGLSGYGWFYVSYIILYVLSPLLNKYFSCLSKKSSIRLIITIFILSTLFGWVGGNSNFNNGYSAVSFIPIYLLGRYLSLFCNRNSYWKHLFLFSLILNIFILFSDIVFFNCLGLARVLSYQNPMIIIQAASILMIFNSIPLHNKVVNFIAKSSFAVYLIHDCAGFQIVSFGALVRNLHSNFHGLIFVIMVIFCLIGIYICALLVDQIRIWIWSKLSRILFRKNEKYYFY